MDEPQIIRTPSGEELVVLTKADYDALLARADNSDEDEADQAMYDARKAELAVGGETLPAEVSAAILKGDSRLKAIRKWRGLSQTEVSERTGIGQGYLSDIESGRRAGAPETVAKLAKALDVPMAWLA